MGKARKTICWLIIKNDPKITSERFGKKLFFKSEKNRKVNFSK